MMQTNKPENGQDPACRHAGADIDPCSVPVLHCHGATSGRQRQEHRQRPEHLEHPSIFRLPTQPRNATAVQ